MVGVDDLRGYNADRGRRRGDEYLLGLTRALGLSLKRPADMACRYTGSTFAVMLPCTNRGGANEVVQRILKTASHLDKLHGSSTGLPLAAVSVGYSSFDELCDNWVSDGRQTRESAPSVVCAADLVEAASLALGEARRSDTEVERYVSVYRAMLERISDQPVQ
jgi:GGDEF domain-containing protein